MRLLTRPNAKHRNPVPTQTHTSQSGSVVSSHDRWTPVPTAMPAAEAPFLQKRQEGRTASSRGVHGAVALERRGLEDLVALALVQRAVVAQQLQQERRAGVGDAREAGLAHGRSSAASVLRLVPGGEGKTH